MKNGLPPSALVNDGRAAVPKGQGRDPSSSSQQRPRRFRCERGQGSMLAEECARRCSRGAVFGRSSG
jgi:hypothetical protein